MVDVNISHPFIFFMHFLLMQIVGGGMRSPKPWSTRDAFLLTKEDEHTSGAFG
jgi:hypothetical protein